MALELLHGSLATIDASLDGDSVKCAFGRWFAQIVRSASSTLTFCSGNWIEERPGAVQLVGRLDGFGSTGESFSSPLAFVTATDPIPAILTADTGTTLSFDANVFEDSLEMVAGGNSGRSIGFRSHGPVIAAGFTA